MTGTEPLLHLLLSLQLVSSPLERRNRLHEAQLVAQSRVAEVRGCRTSLGFTVTGSTLLLSGSQKKPVLPPKGVLQGVEMHGEWGLTTRTAPDSCRCR